jgi:hypothetical protein
MNDNIICVCVNYVHIQKIFSELILYKHAVMILSRQLKTALKINYCFPSIEITF